MIYLDYAASSPVDKEVLKTFETISLNYFANPNSSHKLGLKAKEVLDKSTKNIAKNLNVKEEEIIYTSGASESNNLVVKGICERYKNRGKHILISALEHNSIISPATMMQEKGYEVEIIPVNKEGIIDIEELKKFIRDDTILVSICSVDSELGIKQPIEEIGKLIKEYPNCIFHTDASQAIGKVFINYEDVDLITITPHKFNGINDIGILIKKKNISLNPQINGGKSTTIYRSGTPQLASIVAADQAIDIAIKKQKERSLYVSELQNIIIKELTKYNKIHINSTKNSIPHIINFSIKEKKADIIVKKLEEKEVYISAKTSCCPTGTPSKLVYALTHDKQLASTSIRVSLSHLTTKEEIKEFLKILQEYIKE